MLLPRHHSVALIALLGICVCGTLVPSPAQAQPQVGNLIPRALCTGSTGTIVIEGSGFDASCRLLSELPLEQRVVSSEPGRLVVEVRAMGSPGWYPLWVVSDAGVSAATIVAVDDVVTVPIEQAIERLPIAVHGEVRGDRISQLQVSLTAGERVFLDLQARRLGAAWQPVMRVFDPQERQVAGARPDPKREGDCAAEFIAPLSGVYRIELQDQLRRGANPAFFRLVIGDLRSVTAVHPAARGASQDDVQALVIGGEEGASLLLPGGAGASIGWQPVPFAAGLGLVGPAPGYLITPGAVRMEGAEAAADSLPAALAGSFEVPGELDRWRVRVTPGGRLVTRVWSSRLGMASDPVLEVATLDGAVLGRADDVAGSKDPSLEVTVPGDREELEIRVRDLVATVGSTYVIEALDPAQPQLLGTLERDSLGVPPGGAALVVPIDRSRFSGEVLVQFEPEIPGLLVSGDRVPAGVDRAVLRLQPSAEGFAPQVTRVRLVAADGSTAATRAQRPLDALTRPRPWLAEPIAIAPVQAPSLEVSLAGIANDSVLWSGGSVELPVNVRRAAGLVGPVRLSLVTQQAMPRKRVKEGDREQEVDAIEQALRLESAVTVPAGGEQAAAVLVIPATLPKRSWGLAVIAEALGSDGSTVIAAGVSPITIVQVREGVTATLDSSDPIPLRAGASEPVVIRGSVTRDAALSGPVTVSMLGLPDSIEIPEVMIEETQGRFELSLTIPEGVTLEQLAGVRVTVTVWSESGLPIAEVEPLSVPFVAP